MSRLGVHTLTLSVMLMFLGSIKFLVIMSVLMVICLEIGRYFRLLALKKKSLNTSSDISGPIETVVFAVLGLLMAFTFTGAGARFEARRQLVGVEANAIGTAYLRIDLLAKNTQPQMRELFKKYTLVRANVYTNINTQTDILTRLQNGTDLQKQIWNLARTGCSQAKRPDHCEKLVLPALNDMFDVATTRVVSLENHPPNAIYLLLIFLSLFSALIIGYDLPLRNKRPVFYMLGYSIIISLILYLIFEIELPNYGVINISSSEHVIADLIRSM